MRNAFAGAMLEVGKQNPNLVVLVGDISHGVLQPFAKACPGRYYNIGICEPSMINMAAGLSLVGMNPVIHTIAPFIVERGFEQLKLDFCYQGLGGTLVSIGSAFDYAALGCTHHCYDDLGLMKMLPNTQVIYPSMPNEFDLLFKGTYSNNQMTYFRLPATQHGTMISDDEIKLGQGIMIKSGRDLTLVCIGPQLKTAMNAIPMLQDQLIDPEILYFPTIKPFDYDLVSRSLTKTKNIIVIEEHSEFGGVSEDVLKVIQKVGKVQSHFINIPNRFVKDYGSYQEHCQKLGFSEQNILEQACLMMKSSENRKRH